MLRVETSERISYHHLTLLDRHYLESSTAKQIRDLYQLRQSILNFQIVRVDRENIACPTDCICQTGILQEFEGRSSPSSARR